MIKKFLNYYKIANTQRLTWFSVKWRTIIALASAAAIILVNNYIQAKYAGVIVTLTNGVSFALADKYMDGFASGVVFGIIAVSIMLEGEYVRSVKKTFDQIEHGTVSGFNKLISPPKKSLRTKKRK